MSGILEDSLCENTLDLEDGLQHRTHHRMLIFSRSGIDKCSRSHDPPENTRLSFNRDLHCLYLGKYCKNSNS